MLNLLIGWLNFKGNLVCSWLNFVLITYKFDKTLSLLMFLFFHFRDGKEKTAVYDEYLLPFHQSWDNYFYFVFWPVLRIGWLVGLSSCRIFVVGLKFWFTLIDRILTWFDVRITVSSIATQLVVAIGTYHGGNYHYFSRTAYTNCV